MREPVALAQIHWLSPAEGGRFKPPSGTVYAATARFAADPAGELFSVVLRTTDGSSGIAEGTGQVTINLLAPDQLPEIRARLQPGSELLVTEGARVVATCRIVDVNWVECPQGLN
jgi:hypothetical protein